jgi:DNA polymerase-3 subunit epsilon
MSCLNRTLEYYGLELPLFEYDCTYKLTGKKLKDVCKAHKIDLNNHHDAACDAIACANIYMKISEGEIPVCEKHIKNQETKRKRSKPLKSEMPKPDFENADSSNPFYMKKVLFTGVLKSMDRNEAKKTVLALGAIISPNISRNTNYVITGATTGPAKMKKIEKLQSEGHDIKLMLEEEFLSMVN